MSLWEIVGLILHGLLQYILWLAPLVKPLQEVRWPPWWWLRFWSGADWTYGLDSENRPGQGFIEKYIRAAFSWLKDRILEDAKPYVDSLSRWIRDNLGWLPWGFSSFSAWIFTAFNRIGTVWSRIGDNVGHALTNLWYKIPTAIRENWASWSQLFQDVVDRATDWARARYEDAKNRVYQLFDWWLHLGYNLGTWWQQARGVLDAFRNNPTGFIIARLGPAWNWLIDFRQAARQWVLSWLGTTWTLLSSFAAGPLRFYYDVWGAFRTTLFDFLANPLEFLWDEAEEFLNRKLS